MRKQCVAPAIRVALAASFAVAIAGRADASSILLSNVQVHVDEIGLIASVTGGLEAQSDDGSDVFLEGISVSLAQDGTFLDLFAGPTLLDDAPFLFGLPLSLADDERLPDSTLLFRLSGLAPAASYAGSFDILFSVGGIPDVSASQAFAFSTPASVPEPTTFLLFGSGLAATALARRRRRS